MASMFPPKKNTAFTLYFTLYKNDGTIIANPGAITKKVSIDGAAVADISNAITEEDTTYGQCSVVLTTSEMNGDAIWVYIKDDTAGCVPFTATIYTAGQTMDEIKAETAAILTDTGTTLDGKIDTIDGIVDSILADTGTDGVVVAAASKTGYALSAAGIQAIWDALSSALTTAGSIGKRLVDYLTGDVFGRLGAPAGASVSADVAAVKSDTAAVLVDTGTSGVIVATNSDKTGYSLASAPPVLPRFGAAYGGRHRGRRLGRGLRGAHRRRQGGGAAVDRHRRHPCRYRRDWCGGSRADRCSVERCLGCRGAVGVHGRSECL